MKITIYKKTLSPELPKKWLNYDTDLGLLAFACDEWSTIGSTAGDQHPAYWYKPVIIVIPDDTQIETMWIENNTAHEYNDYIAGAKEVAEKILKQLK